jgi:predicted amidohydrolase YtcJ
VLSDCEQKNIRVKIHCTGDASTRAALDAIDVLRSFNGPGLQHHIAHATFIDPAEIPRFAELDVVADLSPPLWFPSVIIDALRNTVAESVVGRLAPIRDLRDAGALFAGGSDWPVVPDPNPWPAMQGMVTRRDPSGRLEGALVPEQAVGVWDALLAYTLNAALATGLADRAGSIQAGKSADLAVLDRRVLDIDPAELGQTRVLQTWFEGRCVHEIRT